MHQRTMDVPGRIRFDQKRNAQCPGEVSRAMKSSDADMASEKPIMLDLLSLGLGMILVMATVVGL